MVSVYIISSKVNGEKLYKIGFTRRNVDKRIKEFKTGNASELKIEGVFESKWGVKIEKCLHDKFKENKISGEWFNLSVDDVSNFNFFCEKFHNNFELIGKYNTYIIDKNKKEIW